MPVKVFKVVRGFFDFYKGTIRRVWVTLWPCPSLLAFDARYGA
jgi:hypothetical protein